MGFAAESGDETGAGTAANDEFQSSEETFRPCGRTESYGGDVYVGTPQLTLLPPWILYLNPGAKCFPNYLVDDWVMVHTPEKKKTFKSLLTAACSGDE